MKHLWQNQTVKSGLCLELSYHTRKKRRQTMDLCWQTASLTKIQHLSTVFFIFSWIPVFLLMSWIWPRRRRRRDLLSFLDFMGNINSDYDDSYMDGERSSWDDDDDPYADEPWDGYSRGDRSPSHSNGVNLTLNEEEVKPKLMSLFDLSARVTAKYISCEEMEGHQPPLDEGLLKRVAFWASPQDKDQVKTFADLTLRGDNSWKVGEKIFLESKVQDMIQVGFMVTAVVTGSNIRGLVEMAKVSFTFEKQRITSSSCEACPKKIWCSHLIAAILHRIKHANMIPIHAPVTETLSTLSREQLQKLVQYAINEDPGGVLGKVFRRIDQIRDVSSEINEMAGAPDPTFGLGLEGKSTWDLSMEDLRDSFKSACYNASYNFPNSYQETTIEQSNFYCSYLKRVVDLVQKEEIDAAGKVLIVLATVAANETSSSLASKRYQRLLKVIERLCSLYILQFTGQARSDLILLCQNLNKKLSVTAEQSSWAELPLVSELFPHESKEVTGILGAKQTSLFYEPLCVSVSPDPSQDFYYLITGTVEPPESNYDEPLPLMLSRFEAIRQWRLPGKGEKELLRLGAVILRKLNRMTFQLSILKEQDRLKKSKEMKKEKQMKRKTLNEAGDASPDEPPSKQSKVETTGTEPQVPGTSAETPVTPAEVDTVPIPAKRGRVRGRGRDASRGGARNATPANRSNTEPPATRRRSARIMRVDGTKAPSTSLVLTSPPPSSFGTPSPFYTTPLPSALSSMPTPSTSSAVPSTSSAGPSTSTPNEPDVSQNETKKSGDEPDKLTECENLMEFTDSESKSSAELGEAAATVDPNISLECLGNSGEEEIESYPKETLSYCLLHVCRCIYLIKDFNCSNKVEDNEVLASATLRALELARFRTVAENGQTISTEEHSALNYLEQRLIDSYQENKDKMLTRNFSFMLHRLYMKMLCECNCNGVCFFDHGLPLVLISFLVKNALKLDLGQEDKHRARSLAWYTLCHSYKPLRVYSLGQTGDPYYEYKQLEKCFSEIVSTFLYHLRSYPARNSWILKLLKHYEKVKDGKALFYVWSELRDFPYATESEEVQVALVKFLINCIKRHNSRKASFNSGLSTMQNMMEVLCRKLGTKFTEIVLVYWEEMIKFFRTGQLTSLVHTMKAVHTLAKPLSNDMVEVVMNFFSGKFQHDVDSCQLLVFFSPGDESYSRAVGLIRENAANFTPAALLHVAHKQMENQSDSERIPLGNIFSNEVELFINCALHRIGVENKTDNHYYGDKNLLSGTPNVDVQWVFKAFLEKSAELVAKSRQFSELLDLLGETFSNDLQTILSLFSCIEDRGPLLEKCKLRFGARIVELVNRSLFDVLSHINHSSYGRILQQLETIYGYYTKYVTDGREVFKQMLSKMKRVYKTKKKLITMMNQYFPTLMKEL